MKYVTFVHLVSVYVAVDLVFIPLPPSVVENKAYTPQNTPNSLPNPVLLSTLPKRSHCATSSPEEDPAQQLEYQTAEDHESKETYKRLN